VRVVVPRILRLLGGFRASVVAVVPPTPLPADIGALRATLTAVPGVLDVHIDEAGLHLDIRPEAEPDQVEHDVRSLLLHVFGLDLTQVDAKPVSGESGESAELPQPRASEVPAAPAPGVLPGPRLTVIRGGLGIASVNALAGDVPAVPDLDLDMLTEVPPRGVLPQRRRAALRRRERSAYVPPLLDADVPRPVLTRLRTDSTPTRTSMVATLQLAGLILEGSAESAPNPQAARAAVVEATLAALRLVVSPQIQLSGTGVAIVELGEVQIVDSTGADTADVFGAVHPSMGADDVAIVRVRLDGEGGFEELVGVSSVRADSRAAIARATLDAVNRRLASLYTVE
jgi:hypothetical protein